MPLLHSGLLSLPPASVPGCSHQCWQCLVLTLVHLTEGGAVCPEKITIILKALSKTPLYSLVCYIILSSFFIHTTFFLCTCTCMCVCVCVCTCMRACILAWECMQQCMCMLIPPTNFGYALSLHFPIFFKECLIFQQQQQKSQRI